MEERDREELGLEQTAGKHLVQHLAGGKTNFRFRSLCSRAVRSRVLNRRSKKKSLCSCSSNKCIIHLFWLVQVNCSGHRKSFHILALVKILKMCNLYLLV